MPVGLFFELNKAPLIIGDRLHYCIKLHVNDILQI